MSIACYAGVVREWVAARRERLDDRGSGAGAVIIFALVFLSLSAFVIDGGLSISKRERAADIAEQAARYAAQDLDTEGIYEGAKGAPIILTRTPYDAAGRTRRASSPCVRVSLGRKVATLGAISPCVTTRRISALSHDFGGTSERWRLAAKAAGAASSRQQTARTIGRRIRCRIVRMGGGL